jgi:hypothetical protein
MKLRLKLIGATLVAGFAVGNLVAGRATKVADAIWVNDQLYGTVLTDTSFKSPPAHSTDVIFNFDGSGLSGQRSVAEVAPGDPGYNGGRWHVYAVSFTDAGLMEYDPDGDGVLNLELSNAEAVLDAADLGLLTISDTGIFFECPLLRSR